MDARRSADGLMRIGALARQAGVSVQAVRYYERRGILRASRRTPSGYREYGRSAPDRLRFIRHAQALGFTLTEIGELLALRLAPGTTAADIKRSAERKIGAVEQRIRDLERIREALEHLAGRCRGGQRPAGDCPFLDALGPVGREGWTQRIPNGGVGRGILRHITP